MQNFWWPSNTWPLPRLHFVSRSGVRVINENYNDIISLHGNAFAIFVYVIVSNNHSWINKSEFGERQVCNDIKKIHLAWSRESSWPRRCESFYYISTGGYSFCIFYWEYPLFLLKRLILITVYVRQNSLLSSTVTVRMCDWININCHGLDSNFCKYFRAFLYMYTLNVRISFTLCLLPMF